MKAKVALPARLFFGLGNAAIRYLQDNRTDISFKNCRRTTITRRGMIEAARVAQWGGWKIG